MPTEVSGKTIPKARSDSGEGSISETNADDSALETLMISHAMTVF